ncbi:MAG: tRNA (adenosine(37)-N6)-threonylcarbamoyltransferase complex ATPase subunit type 1 TsaE [Prevotellaceae bacterium]|nr:tRNA (adenosine(37)-N6)-threonylcarbamoyltransferase complex ATPase subunit type 1 TsaE [Prevotellaceae bacterium]
MEFHISSTEQINQVAQQFIAAMGGHKLFAFYGEMGAGKTTFIKALCEELGVIDVVNSPTFAIANDYETALGDHIYHFDFYRLKTPQEALDFGVEDYFYSGRICFMEWPDQIGTLLPTESVRVAITVNADGSRSVAADF